MKIAILILITFYANIIIGQTVTIKDSLTSANIKNATLSSSGYGVISNQNGITDISLFNADDIIEISHVSYYPKKVAKKNISSIIYLTQKANILPEITLTELIKTPISEKYPVFTITTLENVALQISAADLLASKSSITIQESQPAGGSPNYRGMEASRLLLILDGVPLNNAIYRSGHIQSSSTINPFFIKSISLLSGPASVAYGNGAMGGALIFKTANPENKKSTCLSQQFESSSNSVITSFKTNYYQKSFSHFTAFSLKSASNLKMGENRLHGYSAWGKELTSQNEQLYTHYDKADLLHKSKYTINNKTALLTNTQYSTSSKIYRFDKMNDSNDDGSNKYEQWYYGPQNRFLQSIKYTSESKNFFHDKATAMLSFQNRKESRHVQKTNETLLNNRYEAVEIYDFNVDFDKQIQKITLAYGTGVRAQNVTSLADLSNNNSSFYNTTRYPDNGSSIKTFFAYTQVNFPINNRLDLLLGGRWNNNRLLAKYNNPAFNFSSIRNNNTSFINTALLSFNAIKNGTINFAYYSGFRNPNIDDLGKVFSKDNIHVVVPNPNLEPEYASNSELSINYSLKPFEFQLQLFNTHISNAINRELGLFNGSDSILYDGKMMRVQMNKNIESASINGISLFANCNISNELTITANCNYLNGETHEKKPLSHIPPFNSKISLSHQTHKNLFSFYVLYNGWKLAEEYDELGVDNLDEATINGTPSWYTMNLDYTGKLDRHITLTLSVKNILDAHYKTFGSGLSSSGRNFIIGLQTIF